MTPLEVLLGAFGGAISALATAVVYLYRREAKRVDTLEALLEAERKARLAAAEKQLDWALSLQEKSNANIDKLATIAEAQQKRRP